MPNTVHDPVHDTATVDDAAIFVVQTAGAQVREALDTSKPQKALGVCASGDHCGMCGESARWEGGRGGAENIPSSSLQISRGRDRREEEGSREGGGGRGEREGGRWEQVHG